ncbi:MAG: hypothetical protein NT010_12525 [Proteobacteria bacterium]|nr:hypothetical protein [Pseudomonadota bacterium]
MSSQEMEERYADFCDNLADIKDRLTLTDQTGDNLVRCMLCDDLFPKQFSKLTGKLCVECYNEREFGIFRPSGTTIGAGTPHSYITSDEDPMLHNCIKILEDD